MEARWSDVDISAYVDGQLDPAALSMFEAALAKDQTLRRRVDAMHEVVTLVRAVPLREPPRNYLLTPAMVAAKPVKRPAPRRPSLLMMRLATSLAAVAFVVTAGLNLVNQGISPRAMVMQSDEAVQAPVLVEVTRQVEVLVAVPQEAPAPESAPVEGERAEKALAPQADMESASAPVAEFAAPAVTPAAAAVTEAPMLAATEGITAPPGMGEGVVVEAETVTSQDTIAVDEVQNVGAASGTGGVQPEEAQELLPYGVADDYAVSEPARKATVLSWWIPGILGVATLCLIGVTYWISRRR